MFQWNIKKKSRENSDILKKTRTDAKIKKSDGLMLKLNDLVTPFGK